MSLLPRELRAGLDRELARHPARDLAEAAARLSERYRAGAAPGGVYLRGETDVAAYAGVRMPATYAATAAALHRAAVPGFLPRGHLDVGGGTGAAIWAAAGAWPSIEQVTVVERDPHAIDLGRRLARTSPALRGATWRRAPAGPGLDRPAADLVTMAYALGELPPEDRPAAVRWLAADAAMVVIVEPGTPAGYATIAAAREVLAANGLTIVAPCPHDGPCPIRRGEDWCHFSVRLPRSALHRRVKAGTLGFEDERFSYVAATTTRWPRAGARVLRHPRTRKGMVSLRVCTDEESVRDVTVSRRQGGLYRLARDTGWGDAWPRTGEEGTRRPRRRIQAFMEQ
ncbi:MULTISPECIES: small ribosomal subunit Rsm22 family protein [unclassified Nonomuraea]|uniref:small ribosomal subunit Rsm22 family protein n=1 Tax=unclassified Nonomuraea TaxID=2593643 RepID=UPI0014873897|nr:small ribosomal subunit Rsm22 family protein [Nonomuraea sp. KC401]